MKTAGHPDLRDNDLAFWLGTLIDRCKPHANAILLAIGVVVLAAGFGTYYVQNSAQKQAELWTRYWELTSVGDTVKLRELANESPSTAAGQWARLALADTKLREGTEDLLRNSAESRVSLQDAQAAYEEVLKVARDPLLIQRALLGLGKSLESLGRVSDAVTQYKEIEKKFAGSFIARQAQERIAALDQTTAKQFYDWLNKQDFKPPMVNEPGFPGLRPGGLDGLNLDAPANSPSTPPSSPSTPSSSPSTPSSEPAPSTDAPKSSEPEKGSEPEKPAEPTKSAEPAKPSEPEKSGQAAPPPKSPATPEPTP